MQTTANDEIKIRTATPEDAEALAAIYAPYVENTSITFEYIGSFRGGIRRTHPAYPRPLPLSGGREKRYSHRLCLRFRFQRTCCLQLVCGNLHLYQSGCSKQWCRQPSLSEAGGISDSTAYLQCMCLHYLSESAQYLLFMRNTATRPWHIFMPPASSRGNGMT